MLSHPVVNALWFELTRIARTEIMMDKIEDMLRDLDIPEKDDMWGLLNQMQGYQEAALARWTITWDEATSGREVRLQRLWYWYNAEQAADHQT